MAYKSGRGRLIVLYLVANEGLLEESVPSLPFFLLEYFGQI